MQYWLNSLRQVVRITENWKLILVRPFLSWLQAPARPGPPTEQEFKRRPRTNRFCLFKAHLEWVSWSGSLPGAGPAELCLQDLHDHSCSGAQLSPASKLPLWSIQYRFCLWNLPICPGLLQSTPWSWYIRTSYWFVWKTGFFLTCLNAKAFLC